MHSKHLWVSAIVSFVLFLLIPTGLVLLADFTYASPPMHFVFSPGSGYAMMFGIVLGLPFLVGSMVFAILAILKKN
jgi:hypothetical protein